MTQNKFDCWNIFNMFLLKKSTIKEENYVSIDQKVEFMDGYANSENQQL